MGQNLDHANRASGYTAISSRINLISTRIVASATASYGSLGLGFMEARAVYLLDRTPNLRSSQVADLLSIHRSAISRTLQTLMDRDLVAFKRTGRTFSLTDPGRELHGRIEAIAKERERRLLEGLTASETEQFLDFLDRVLANMPSCGSLTVRLVEDREEVLAG